MGNMLETQISPGFFHNGLRGVNRFCGRKGVSAEGRRLYIISRAHGLLPFAFPTLSFVLTLWASLFCLAARRAKPTSPHCMEESRLRNLCFAFGDASAVTPFQDSAAPEAHSYGPPREITNASGYYNEACICNCHSHLALTKRECIQRKSVSFAPEELCTPSRISLFSLCSSPSAQEPVCV